MLAAGLALVLAHRVARQLLAARPLLGRGDSPRRPSPVFFALPLLAYLALVPWSAARRQPDGDEPFYLLITHSLVHDRDADLANDYAGASWRAFMDRPLEPQPGDPVGPRGQRYSRHNELLPMALAPAYAVGGKLGALATMAAFAAALAWTTLRLARHYLPGRPGAALAAYALVAFTPPLLLYAHQVWVEVPAALLAMLALDRIRSAGGRPWRRRDWLGIGLPILLLPLLKIRFMLVALPLLLLAWWRSGRPRGPVLALAALLAAVGGGILVYNHLHFGNPLKIHTLDELEPTRYGALDYVLGGLGLFFDAGFGLFAAAPLWLLLLPAAAVLARRGRPLLADLAVLVLPYLLLVLPRPEWYGGWSPPFRYALVALPLLGIAAASLFDAAPARRRPLPPRRPRRADPGAGAPLDRRPRLDLQLRARPHLPARPPRRAARRRRGAPLPQLGAAAPGHLALAARLGDRGAGALGLARPPADGEARRRRRRSDRAPARRRRTAAPRRAPADAHGGDRGPAGGEERRPPLPRAVGGRAHALPRRLGAARRRALGGAGRARRPAACASPSTPSSSATSRSPSRSTSAPAARTSPPGGRHAPASASGWSSGPSTGRRESRWCSRPSGRTRRGR